MNSIEKYHAQRKENAASFQKQEPVRQNRAEKPPEKPQERPQQAKPVTERKLSSMQNYLGKNIDTRA